jgi:hypothetical protein
MLGAAHTKGGGHAPTRGFYQGQLLAIDPGEYWTWKFVVLHQGQKHYLKCFTSDKLYGKTKKYVEALLNRPLEKGEELDPSYLHGFSGSLDVGIVTKNGRQYNSIEDIT